ncbi:Pyridoxal 5'-phosphate synthase subunit PdxT [Caprobacter fermentans]|uniref:Pyridoxal 5'-phosphate synthase subunit PdxT n=1 Tax=Caproicibacter fermentans TaxID=2576756 RepID=A0A6N8HXL1_9FIRM|nr:pyridoxal 5'-phosphate synthase glutaminase subunit PdxT [Caproicibacter fermentans]MVB10492.1 Pyridoxal 5'-phosphate synthase subunit PdxT [Caproicibacter fermentans]OCN00749.1 glutamine amidotransferase subunit PdxT [Clostridium sp. W14A]QNK41688.1 pyridoxal 5'-phosphate synthase glutaminase subunit PdxT [Caproicibacter fermentans]
MAKDLQVGVLSLQGSVEEHRSMLGKIKNVKPIEVKSLTALESVNGIILPGGESTTISKLLIEFGLFEPLKQRIKQGLPVWGTCAGMILLAKDVIGENPHLGLMDITVRRNAYGRQINSFTVSENIPALSEQRIELPFIRAPWIENVGKDVEVLCSLNKHIVAAKERNMLVTSFHPELTDCLAVHQYFIEKMIRAVENNK